MIFWIKPGNDTFIAFQMKAFGTKSHAQVKKCHFGNFSKTAKWYFLTLNSFVPNAFDKSAMKCHYLTLSKICLRSRPSAFPCE